MLAGTFWKPNEEKFVPGLLLLQSLLKEEELCHSIVLPEP